MKKTEPDRLRFFYNSEMRLDVFLKTSRLIKSRSVAQEFCDAGMVEINGSSAKSSKEVKAGDKLTIRRRNRVSEYSIESIPAQKQIPKDKAPELYRIISETPIADV
jgi:ribosome-associated heat shock protein Hsp15